MSWVNSCQLGSAQDASMSLLYASWNLIGALLEDKN